MTNVELAEKRPELRKLRFKVTGLDCQNEVRQLKAAVGSLVGGDERLSFDTKSGAMEIGPTEATVETIAAAVSGTGMRATLWPAEPSVLVFDVEGLDCQNEVRQLKTAVGPLVGGDERLDFNTGEGTMSVHADGPVPIEAVCAAVSGTGMTATPRLIEAREALRFRVQEMDCQNEVRQLKAALGPLVGEAVLSFDLKARVIEVASQTQASAEAIVRAIAGTGMNAVPIDSAATPQDTAPSAICESCSGEQSLSPPIPTKAPDQVVFKIHGMDCGDEVAVLKRELASIVGGEGKLAFDLVNGRMSVSRSASDVPFAAIEKAVARTGMKAEPWQDGTTTAAGLAEDQRRRVQSVLTAASGSLAATGFALHAVLGGGIAAALGIEGAAETTPWPAVAAYALSVLCAVRYVAPKALLAARRMRPDMNLLMVVAVSGAIGIGEWFEAATVSFFFALALALESWSLGRARRAVAALMELAPVVARVRSPDGSEREVAAGDVAIGSHVVVRPGDKIPLDGVVFAGESEVNQAPITGESVPVPVEPGSAVFAGTINGEGALEIETSKAAQDTTLARIIRMVGSAQNRRAPSEQWVERFARFYTPAVMALAFAVFLAPPLLLGGGWETWFYRALVLLVIACPCALVISTPVTIVAALAGAAKQGVLVKGGIHLETPAKLKSIALDKTGTLTQGRPKIVDIVPIGGKSPNEILEFAAALEARSEHPLAKAVLEAAAERGISATPATGVQAIRGKGVIGRIGEREAWLGSRSYLRERANDQPLSVVLEKADVLAGAGRTVVAVGDDKNVWGLIAVADAIRPEAAAVVSQLHAAGIERIVMLTGDNTATARVIAQQTGIDEVRAELLPEQKVQAVEDLVARHGSVAMIGDGVNDAPAMARANLGIAMGAIGSDAAIETADVALMSDDLSKLPWLIRHSRATLGIIRQNIGFSLGVKLLFTVLTVVGIASLWGAIAADVGAALLVVLNGLRLLNRGEAAT